MCQCYNASIRAGSREIYRGGNTFSRKIVIQKSILRAVANTAILLQWCNNVSLQYHKVYQMYQLKFKKMILSFIGTCRENVIVLQGRGDLLGCDIDCAVLGVDGTDGGGGTSAGA